MQEFDSYPVPGLASDYLDEKLNDAWRVELPDKDLQQWKIVYEFINPTTMKEAEITNDNVIILVPGSLVPPSTSFKYTSSRKNATQ